MNTITTKLWEAYDLQTDLINKQLKPHQTISNLGQGGESDHTVLDNLKYAYHEGELSPWIEAGLYELNVLYDQIAKEA